MIDHFKKSLLKGFKNWRPVLFVYVSQLLLVMLMGIQAFQLLQQGLGPSLALNDLVFHFDYTVLMDFIHVYKNLIINLLKELQWLLPIWFLSSVYLNIGLIYSALTAQNSNVFSIRNANKYFVPFLKISLLFLSLIIIWLAICLLPLLINLQSLLSRFDSEKLVLYLFLLCIGLSLLGMMILFYWSSVSRLLLIKNGGSIFKTIQAAGGIVWHKKQYLLFLLVVVCTLQWLIYLLCKFLDSQLDSSSWFFILTGIIVQQGYIFNKIQWRLVMFSFLGTFVKDHPAN